MRIPCPYNFLSYVFAKGPLSYYVLPRLGLAVISVLLCWNIHIFIRTLRNCKFLAFLHLAAFQVNFPSLHLYHLPRKVFQSFPLLGPSTASDLHATILHLFNVKRNQQFHCLKHCFLTSSTSKIYHFSEKYMILVLIVIKY